MNNLTVDDWNFRLETMGPLATISDLELMYELAPTGVGEEDLVVLKKLISGNDAYQDF